ncbi:hypothetical protein BGX28_005700 [Mortierella sp. GBA30]|nr:hypothetical protein BGX28_005700 [Mortierella sp. GBA30]
MPPKNTLKSVITKSTSAKPPKDAAKKTATKASEIDDIFSTGTIAALSPSSKTPKDSTVNASSNNKEPKSKPANKKSKDQEKTKDQAKTKEIETNESSDDDTPLGESLDDSEDESEVDEADLMFDAEEQNESEESALAKLKAKKNKASTSQSQDVNKPAAVTNKAKSGPKVEAVVFNERPAAAAAAAAAAKIQKFKRARDDGPDSDDELEKKGKRRTDDGLRLFDIHDLNIGKGGGTDKCPFDCECCY